MTGAPKHPRLVLAAALFLPGSGHVMLGVAPRGLMFLFFIIVLSWTGNRVMPDLSFFGRHAGGIFIYGLSVIDAYKLARIRWETWKFAQEPPLR